jgi:uncharacterized Fe-S cluster-containing radical SAM superfamily protein
MTVDIHPAPTTLDDAKLAAALRAKSVDLTQRKLLMTRFPGSDQAEDLTLPPNCAGFGRLHHFRERVDERWVANPLPSVPARAYLALPPSDLLIAQVFQLAACNWRCWYCFVDFKLLSANMNHAAFASPDELLVLMQEEGARSQVLDLSGGQPDLVPEYPLWFLQARERLGLARQLFVWIDDNLSNDYLWRYLPEGDIRYMVESPGVARVGCLKGIDEESFVFNTKAPQERFWTQVEVLARLVSTGFDQYGYITLTTPSKSDLRTKVARLFDVLQRDVHRNFPLRIIPLRVGEFRANSSRYDGEADANQYHALDAWMAELEARFTAAERALPINEVVIRD